jgi:hypothetical protein
MRCYSLVSEFKLSSLVEPHHLSELLGLTTAVHMLVLSDADLQNLRPPTCLFTRLIPSRTTCPNMNILIVGPDQKEVERTYQTKMEEMKTDWTGVANLSSLGGILVGAAATFIALACP